MMTCSVVKFPDGFYSFIELRICGYYNLIPRLRFFFLRSISAIS